ncbi:Panacea domain-containing protein [Sphingomonas sp. T9W2]|uniref:Panacea domain-containing protein n=1 Tax=Sphingomonas sp. T9W2 TaxID=3143183 RepID=UPI0031F48267
MAYRSVEIANEFLSQPGAASQLTQMQLQKLTYLANGWNWAINGERLVADPVEAWDYGPVYRDLYDHTKYFGRQPLRRLISSDDGEAACFFGAKDGRGEPYRASLNDREKAVIAQVWKRYGNMSGAQLSAITHMRDTPWFTTYTTQGKSAEIDQAIIHRHYDLLADRAQQNAA